MNVNARRGLGGLVLLPLLVWGAAADPIQDIIGQASLGEYQSYLKVLTGVDPVPGDPPVYLTNRYSRGPQAQVAGQWIRSSFDTFGLDTSIQSFALSGGYYGQNVIGELPGTTRPEDVYIICGHYDTAWTNEGWNQPGCDDNASGTGAVMLAARIFAQYQFEGTIRFIAFSGEEQGLVGSAAYVSAAAAAGENIVAAINLDMILHPGFDNADPDPDYDLDIGKNSSSAWLADYIAGQFGLYTSIDVQVYNAGSASDHYSFWQHGYDALWLSENTASEICGANYEYHTAYDIFDNPHLDWDFGLETVRGSMAGLVGLAGLIPEPSAALLLGALVLLASAGRRRGSAVRPANANPPPQRRAPARTAGIRGPVASARGTDSARRSFRRAAGCAAAVLAAASLCPADTIYVDDDLPIGGDGQSWFSAFKHLQDALAVAAAGDEIRVAQGTYKPDQSQSGVVTPGDRTATFNLAGVAALRGGYRGCPDGDCEGGDPDERDIALYETVLSGDLLGNDSFHFSNYTDNSFHVVTIAGAGDTVLVDGVTVTAGYGPNPGSLLCVQSSPVISRCKFIGNHSAGLCFQDGGQPLVEDCTIADNKAYATYSGSAGVHCSETGVALVRCLISGNTAGAGAGLYVGSGQVTLTDCAITGNAASIPLYGGGSGGGVLCAGGHVLLTNCVIRWNVCERYGGGIGCAWGGTVTCDGCLIADNWAWGELGDGGGVSCEDGTLNLSSCTLVGNFAGGDGGACRLVATWQGTTAAINDCVFAGNGAVYGGGAISIAWASQMVNLTCVRCVFTGNVTTATSQDGRGGAISASANYAHCLFAQAAFCGNEARHGGALDFDAQPTSNFTLADCAVIGNVSRATASAGALHVHRPMPGTVTNCTFSGNWAAGSGAAVVWTGGAASLSNSIYFGDTPAEILDGGNVAITFSDVQGGWPGAGNIDADPQFAGGPSGTWTAPGAHDYATHRVTLTDATAAWTDGALVGSFVKPDVSSALQFLIIANTATTLTIWADRQTVATGLSWVPAGATYQVSDFRLSPGSPCINAGSNLVPGLSDVDLLGAPRVQQCRPDMGAYESPLPPEPPPDCNGNGELDDCDLYAGTSSDCNLNWIPDECDIAGGMSADCNENLVPDECESQADCNQNGVLDICDLYLGTSQDCNANTVPDECEPQDDCNGNGVLDICELYAGTSHDCNGNGVLDECEIAGGSPDCNGNGFPDECDLASGTSADCNFNGVPDECDVASGYSEDCNANGVPDQCDVMYGTSTDVNFNYVPDECESVGDLNCDGATDFGDINPFVLYLSNYAAWLASFPGCDPVNGDINGDGIYGQGALDDINPFVTLLTWWRTEDRPDRPSAPQ